MTAHKAVLLLQYSQKNGTLHTPLGVCSPAVPCPDRGTGVFYFTQQPDGCIHELQLVNPQAHSPKPSYFEVIGKLVGFQDGKNGLVIEVQPQFHPPFQLRIDLKSRLKLPMKGTLKINGVCKNGLLLATKVKVTETPARRRASLGS